MRVFFTQVRLKLSFLLPLPTALSTLWSHRCKPLILHDVNEYFNASSVCFKCIRQKKKTAKYFACRASVVAPKLMERSLKSAKKVFTTSLAKVFQKLIYFPSCNNQFRVLSTWDQLKGSPRG